MFTSLKVLQNPLEHVVRILNLNVVHDIFGAINIRFIGISQFSVSFQLALQNSVLCQQYKQGQSDSQRLTLAL